MKKPMYEKMKSMFPLIAHDYHEIGPVEEVSYRLAMGNTFNTRVVGLEPIKRLRREHPNCAITFKPNHLSEADFIVLGVIFRRNGMRVLIEGGNNLFIEEIDIFRDVLPALVHPNFQKLTETHHLTIADYLSSRGAFKVFRSPVTLKQADGTEIKLGRKEILSLSRAYRQHLVEHQEMYLTFPGFSTIRSSLLDLLKMDGTKTGRSYSGRIDGFHHLPFQMDIEAAVDAGVDVYIVPVNIAYERVLEDENFQELTRMHEAGVSQEKIYINDMGFIIRRFCEDKRKVHLSVKFGEPRKIDARPLWGDVLGTKIKFAAHTAAKETFERVMSMQPVFPANIYFHAFDEQFNRLTMSVMREKIDDIRDHLRHLVWGRQRQRIDLYYVMGYHNQIMSADEIINRTFEVFAALEKPVTSLDGDMFVVHNREVALQYRNHVAHFFEPVKK
jgi:glycerol-3-phosphate O-acyltransferase